MYSINEHILYNGKQLYYDIVELKINGTINIYMEISPSVDYNID